MFSKVAFYNSMANKLSTKMQSNRHAMWQKIEQGWRKGKVGECSLKEKNNLNEIKITFYLVGFCTGVERRLTCPDG